MSVEYNQDSKSTTHTLKKLSNTKISQSDMHAHHSSVKPLLSSNAGRITSVLSKRSSHNYAGIDLGIDSTIATQDLKMDGCTEDAAIMLDGTSMRSTSVSGKLHAGSEYCGSLVY